MQLEAVGYHDYFTYVAAVSTVFPVGNYLFTMLANKDHNSHV